MPLPSEGRTAARRPAVADWEMSQSNIEQALFDVIGRIYDAALEPALWDSVTERVARLFDGTSMVFFSARDPKSRRTLGNRGFPA